MKAIVVLLFAAGITKAATLPVHVDARDLTIRNTDDDAEVNADADAEEAADAEDEDANAEDAEANADDEEANAEDAEANAEDEEANAEDAEANAQDEEANAEDAEAEDAAEEEVADEENADEEAADENAVAADDIASLDIAGLLSLNLNELADFNQLGLDAGVLATGVSGLLNSFFPGFVDVNNLAVLNAGQLFELMTISQTLLNANVFGLIDQTQLVQLLGSGFIGALPIGLADQVPVNLAALGI